MKTPRTLLAKLPLSATDRPSGDGARAGGDAGQDHVDAVNQMFAEFELAYHNQFHKAYGAEGSIGLAKKYWLSCLSGYPPAVILRATREVVRRQEFLPSLSALVAACEDAETLFGLPSAREAYVEACCAPQPKCEHRWSHAAVYYAGREAGWFVLSNEPESKAFPLFEYHYRLACRRVLHGEDLEVDTPQALPEKTGRDLSPEENRERLKALREELKL